MAPQNVPHSLKLQILQTLRTIGCGFPGDHLDLDATDWSVLRRSLGRKVPWLWISQTVGSLSTETVCHPTGDVLAIGRTFVVKLHGTQCPDIEWHEEMRPFFRKVSPENRPLYTSVTKGQIIRFCREVFVSPGIVFPKTENYPREWLIRMLVLQSTYASDLLDDADTIRRAQEAVRGLSRKKPKESSPLVLSVTPVKDLGS